MTGFQRPKTVKIDTDYKVTQSTILDYICQDVQAVIQLNYLNKSRKLYYFPIENRKRSPGEMLRQRQSLCMPRTGLKARNRGD